MADGSNEIAAIPELLRLLALEGCVVTADAIGCQTAVAAQVTPQGADDVLASKGNRPAWHEAVRVLFAESRRPGSGSRPSASGPAGTMPTCSGCWANEMQSARTGCAHARACGATLAVVQPQEDLRVRLDPDGHPFCRYLEASGPARRRGRDRPEESAYRRHPAARTGPGQAMP